jgi:TetR/AcrR family transcriptional regulator
VSQPHGETNDSIPARKLSRKDQILQALALELEQRPGERITTANLAKTVGVSEAALYRHFPSKAKMFEALLAFSEDNVFGMINQVIQQQADIFSQLEQIAHIILTFSTKNPGITRVLTGDALIGEHERLLKRTDQFFQRLETQLRQILREAELKKQISYQGNTSAVAEVITAYIEGQLNCYVRSRFTRSPNDNWNSKWQYLVKPLQ